MRANLQTAARAGKKQRKKEDVKDGVDDVDQREMMRRLQEPFPPACIEWRIGRTNEEKTRGLAFAYVTNRAIQNRLDEVFGPFGWQNEFREWKNTSQICGISVYNEEKQQWITKWDGSDDSQVEAVKGGLSDSMKRAACQWGIGRYLYELEPIWVQLKQVGKSYVMEHVPELPDWALPEGYRRSGQKQQPQKQHHMLLPEEHRQRMLRMAQERGYNEEYITKWAQRNLKNPNLRLSDLSDRQITKIEQQLGGRTM